eukprot:jgi/Mesvir1/20440/Mv12337-RA.1
MARGEFQSYKTMHSAKAKTLTVDAATKPGEARRQRRKSLGDTSVRREQVNVPWHHLSALRRSPDEITLSSVLRRIPGLMEPDKICVVGHLVAKVDALHPKFTQVTNVFLSNNCITDLAGLAQFRQVKALSLASNKIDDICQLDVLAKHCPDLKILVLDGNPITSLPNYRAHAIHRLPSLKSLDHKAITATERAIGATAIKQEENLMDVMMNNVIQIFKLERALTLLRVHMELRGVVYSRMASFNRDDIPLYTPFELHRFLAFCELEQRLSREERLALLSMLHRKVRHAYVRVSRSNLIPEQLMQHECFREMANNSKAETQRAVQRSWELAFTEVMTQLQSRVAKLLGLVAKAKEQIDTAYERLFVYDPFGRFQKSKEEQESRLNMSKQEREELIEEFQSTMQSFLESFQLTGVTAANDSTMMRTLPDADGPGDAGGDQPLSSTWGTPWTLPHPNTEGKKGAPSTVAGSKRQRLRKAAATGKALNSSIMTRGAGAPVPGMAGPSAWTDAPWRDGVGAHESILSMPRGPPATAQMRDNGPSAYFKLSRSTGALDSDEDDRTPRRLLPRSEMSTPVRLDPRPTQASLGVPIKLPTTPKTLAQQPSLPRAQPASDDIQIGNASTGVPLPEATSLAATLPGTLRDLRATTHSYSQRHTREKQLRHLAKVGGVRLPVTDIKTAAQKSSGEADGDPSSVAAAKGSPRKHLSRDIMAKSPLAPRSPTVAKTPFGICVTPAPALALFQLKLKQGHRRKALGGSAAGNRSFSSAASHGAGHMRAHERSKGGRSGKGAAAAGSLGVESMTVLEEVAEQDGGQMGYGDRGMAPYSRMPSAYEPPGPAAPSYGAIAGNASAADPRESQHDAGLSGMDRPGLGHDDPHAGLAGNEGLAREAGGVGSHQDAAPAGMPNYPADAGEVDWRTNQAAVNQVPLGADREPFQETDAVRTEASQAMDGSAWQTRGPAASNRVAAASSTSPARPVEPSMPRDATYNSPGRGRAPAMQAEFTSRLGEAGRLGEVPATAGGMTGGYNSDGGSASDGEGRGMRKHSPFRTGSAGQRVSGDDFGRAAVAGVLQPMMSDAVDALRPSKPVSLPRAASSLPRDQGPSQGMADFLASGLQVNSQAPSASHAESPSLSYMPSQGQRVPDGGLAMAGPDKSARDALLHEAQVAALQVQLSQLRADLLAHAQGESRLQALNVALRDRLQQLQSESTRDVAATESQLAALTAELERCRAMQAEWEAKAAALRGGQAAAEQALEERATLWMKRESEAEYRVKALEKAKEGVERAREEERSRAERELAAARAQVEEERRAREQREAQLRQLEEEHMRAWENNAALQAQLNAVEEKDYVTTRSYALACRAILRRNLQAWAHATSSRHKLARQEKLVKAQCRRRLLRLGLSMLILATSRSRAMTHVAKGRAKRVTHLALLAWTAYARLCQYLRAIACRRGSRALATAFQRWRGYLCSRADKRRVYAVARRHASIRALARSWAAWECHVAACRLTPAEEKKGTVVAAVQYRSLCLRRAWFAWGLWRDAESRPRAQRISAMRARADARLTHAVIQRWGRDYMQRCERARRRKARADSHYSYVLRRKAMRAWRALRSSRKERRAKAALADRRYLSWCFHVWRCALLAILEERFLDRKADRLRQCLLVRRGMCMFQLSVALAQQRRLALGKAGRYCQRTCARRVGLMFRAWAQHQERRRRLKSLCAVLHRRRRRQALAAAFHRWRGLLLSTRAFAVKELQDELQAAQASIEERDGRVVVLEIEGVRAVDRLQEASVQLARVTSERDKERGAVIELQQEAERARAVERGLRSQLEQAAARHEAYEKELGEVKAEMARGQEAALDQEAHHVLRTQALERQMAALKEELAGKELVLSSCEKALETTAARLESTAEESAAKATAAYDLVASLRSLLEEKDKALGAAKACEDLLRNELEEARQQMHATNATVQQAAALRDLRLRELEAALAASERKLEHTKAELEDAEQRATDGDAEVDRLAFQVKLLSERERRRVEDILERMRLAGVTTAMTADAATAPITTGNATATSGTSLHDPLETTAASPRLGAARPSTVPTPGTAPRSPHNSPGPGTAARASPNPPPHPPTRTLTSPAQFRSPAREALAQHQGLLARASASGVNGRPRGEASVHPPGVPSPSDPSSGAQMPASARRGAVPSRREDAEDETPRFVLPDRERGPWAPLDSADGLQAGARDDDESDEGEDDFLDTKGRQGGQIHTDFPGFPAARAADDRREGAKWDQGDLRLQPRSASKASGQHTGPIRGGGSPSLAGQGRPDRPMREAASRSPGLGTSTPTTGQRQIPGSSLSHGDDEGRRAPPRERDRDAWGVMRGQGGDTVAGQTVRTTGSTAPGREAASEGRHTAHETREWEARVGLGVPGGRDPGPGTDGQERSRDERAHSGGIGNLQVVRNDRVVTVNSGQDRAFRASPGETARADTGQVAGEPRTSQQDRARTAMQATDSVKGLEHERQARGRSPGDTSIAGLATGSRRFEDEDTPDLYQVTIPESTGVEGGDVWKGGRHGGRSAKEESVAELRQQIQMLQERILGRLRDSPGFAVNSG